MNEPSGLELTQENERPLRVAFLLPGLGRVQRGAETAFLEVARALQTDHHASVDLFGSGPQAPSGVRMHQVRCIPREVFERWPRLPGLRSEYHYEELSFVMNLAWSGLYRPRDCRFQPSRNGSDKRLGSQQD
jgi:hypothetical protein